MIRQGAAPISDFAFHRITSVLVIIIIITKRRHKQRDG